MPHKSGEDSSEESKNFVFLMAIAGRIDAQTKIFARKLDKDRSAYYPYSVVDSASSSYSMFKYFIEVFFSNKNNPDLMQNIMTSPEGIAAFSCEFIFLVTYSFLATYYDGKDLENSKIKPFIVASWPYFRDTMKGLKNAYKGWKSAVQFLNLLGGVDIKYLIVPVGLALGVVAVANRLWLRRMVESRKIIMQVNKDLLVGLQSEVFITQQEYDEKIAQIRSQDEKEQICAFFAVAAGGLIDGLYLYAGVASLAILVPPAYVAMAVISFLYTFICIVSRVYEEYDFQLRLRAIQTRCLLALSVKRLSDEYRGLLEIKDTDPLRYNEMRSEVLRLISEVEELRKQLAVQTTHTYFTAMLLGLKHGLFAYGVLSSAMFMVSSVFLISSAAFPPALLIACISIGLFFLISVTAYMAVKHYKHLHRETDGENDAYIFVQRIKDNINSQADGLPDIKEFNEALKDGIEPKGSPQSFFQEFLEILRSLVSGIPKGNNFALLVLLVFQYKDPQGHEHDVPVSLMLSIACASLFSVILGLRALARGFGRAPLGQISAAEYEKKAEAGKTVPVEKKALASDDIKGRTTSDSIKTTLCRRLSFFGDTTSKQANKVLGLMQGRYTF